MRTHIIFVIDMWKKRAAESVRMKCWATTLGMLAVLSASLELAEDFKTIDGKVYKDATISRVEADGIVLKTKTGISKVYFAELPKDVQERFLPTHAKAVATQHKPEPVKEAKQDAPQQTDKGGRVVVVGQSALSLKVIVAGIIVLVVVVLAIVRSRF